MMRMGTRVTLAPMRADLTTERAWSAMGAPFLLGNIQVISNFCPAIAMVSTAVINTDLAGSVRPVTSKSQQEGRHYTARLNMNG
jgi:hypothetical protein